MLINYNVGLCKPFELFQLDSNVEVQYTNLHAIYTTHHAGLSQTFLGVVVIQIRTFW